MAPSAIASITEEYIAPVPTFRKLSSAGVVTGNRDDGSQYAKQLIGEALYDRINGIDHNVCDVGDEDAFFVADLGEVYRQHLRWKMKLPRVKPHYGESFATRRTRIISNVL
jgi:ornithine decarboxylase